MLVRYWISLKKIMSILILISPQHLRLFVIDRFGSQQSSWFVFFGIGIIFFLRSLDFNKSEDFYMKISNNMYFLIINTIFYDESKFDLLRNTYLFLVIENICLIIDENDNLKDKNFNYFDYFIKNFLDFQCIKLIRSIFYTAALRKRQYADQHYSLDYFQPFL